MGKALKGLIITIVIISVLVGLVWLGYSAQIDHQHDMLAKGCIPKTLDSIGIPRIYHCSAGFGIN
jgi:hypothetical protein